MPIYGQDNIAFIRLSLEQGLSQSIVECITQDHQGFLWLGTEDGLNRYDGYNFIVLKNEPGDSNSLSYNHITELLVDRKNRLWIGTFNGGLNLYDPRDRRITRFRNDPDDSSTISNDLILSLFEDSKGTIWIGTADGLNRYLPAAEADRSDSFCVYKNNQADPASLSNSRIQSIYEDREGILWIGTASGLNRCSDADRSGGLRFIHYYHDPLDSKTLSDNSIQAIYQDKRGVVWIGTDNGLNKMTPPTAENSNGLFTRYLPEADNPTSLSHPQVTALFEDKFNVFWVGTNGGGLNSMDREKESFTCFTYSTGDSRSIGYDEIRCIFEDRSGVLWIGTYGGGVSKVDRARKKFKTYPASLHPSDPNEEIVWSIYEDEQGMIWLGTHGGGLTKFDRSTGIYTTYRHDPNDPSSLSNNIVRLIIQDPSGDLWVGTHGGGLNRFNHETEKFTIYTHDPNDPHSLSHNELRALYLDSNGELWIGTRGGGLDKLVQDSNGGTKSRFLHYRHDRTDETSISNDFIRSIFEDNLGNIWVGTLGGGLNKLDTASGRFSHYRAHPDDPASLSNDYVFSIIQDESGLLWLATWGGGLNRLDPATGTFIRFTTKDGLAHDGIYGLLSDSYGNIWMSTNMGLSRFNPKKKIFRNYTVEDGLQNQEFCGGSYFKSNRGEMFFGGIEGFNAFFPGEIRDNPHIPPVIITSFQKPNEWDSDQPPLWTNEELILSFRDYVFTFEFSALDFTSPEKNQYAYKMEGLDQDWIYTTYQKRFATYTTLPPGKYIFRVKGSNNDGVWNNEGTYIRIRILPPFWKTPYFILLIIMIIFSGAWVLYRRRLRIVRLRTELQAAHDAQMYIMPQTDPEIEHLDLSGITVPANEVGGDFYDYIWLNNERNKLLLYIGDVSGKGMKAAMTAVMTSGMISLKAKETDSAGSILTSVNRSLCGKIQKNMFTAVCLAVLELDTMMFSFSNAGLEQPLLKSGDFLKFLKANGTTYPLGSFIDNDYNEKKIPLHPGDVILLFSDGILEARNSAMDFFGQKRLLDLVKEIDCRNLSAKKIRDNIISAINSFTAKAHQYDDMTLIVMKIM